MADPDLWIGAAGGFGLYRLPGRSYSRWTAGRAIGRSGEKS
jgi:hypothetical protein